MNERLRILRLNFWKWRQKFDHKDLQILELGSWDFLILTVSASTGQSLWVILCHLPEKGRKEIAEVMKKRDREERGTGMKVKKQKK